VGFALLVSTGLVVGLHSRIFAREEENPFLCRMGTSMRLRTFDRHCNGTRRPARRMPQIFPRAAFDDTRVGTGVKILQRLIREIVESPSNLSLPASSFSIPRVERGPVQDVPERLGSLGP